MENADQQVLSQLTRWVENRQMAWLCTVVKTWGSSPRPVGSLLCCNDHGHVAGSLSGGCIEEDLLDRLKNGTLAAEKPELLIYGATQEEVERYQLPCGGQLHVVIEPIPDQRHLQKLRQIVKRLEMRECIERTLDISNRQHDSRRQGPIQAPQVYRRFRPRTAQGEKLSSRPMVHVIVCSLSAQDRSPCIFPK